MRILVGVKTRLEDGLITGVSTLHQSLALSPQVLKSPDDMSTTRKLKALVSGFKLKYAPLNEFETYCKDNWNTLVRDTELFPSVLSLFLFFRWTNQILLSSAARAMSSALQSIG